MTIHHLLLQFVLWLHHKQVSDDCTTGPHCSPETLNDCKALEAQRSTDDDKILTPKGQLMLVQENKIPNYCNVFATNMSGY